MSRYEVNRFLHDLSVDETARAAAQRDPADALRAYDLDDEERALLLDGQVGQLHQRGVHSFLLHHLQRFGVGGMTLETYVQRIRHETGDS